MKRIGFPWAFTLALLLTGLGLYAGLNRLTFLSMGLTMVSAFLLGWVVNGITHTAREARTLRKELASLRAREVAVREWRQVDV